MGYVVRYGDTVPKTVPVKAGKYRLPVAVLLIAVCIAASGYLLKGEIREALFPWTEESVQSAFAEFREELWEGESFGTSFENFCRDVIWDAKTVS